MKQMIPIMLILSLVSLSQSALAESFWKIGKVKRTYSDQIYYSGCLVMLDNPIGNGCPVNGYFTLDCMGKVYNNPENSQRMYADALAAMHADKTIRVYIDNTKKVNGYCAARVLRVDK